MTKAREKAIKMYWGIAKEKCPFQTEEIVNGYLEGFIDCAELFEEEDKLTLTKYSRIIIDKKDECIEELEKENKTLEGCLLAEQEHTLMLEKENAELKEELKDSNEKVVHLACNQNKDLKYKLTKATEIIKDLLEYNKEHWLYSDIKKQAEQFLKE